MRQYMLAEQEPPTVSCGLWVFFLPDAMVPQEQMVPAHVKLGAGMLEQPLVRAYVLGNKGEYPVGNVKESGQRSWVVAAVALGLYSDGD